MFFPPLLCFLRPTTPGFSKTCSSFSEEVSFLPTQLTKTKKTPTTNPHQTPPQAREITNGVAPEPFRWTAEALLALQEVSGAFFFFPFFFFASLSSSSLCSLFLSCSFFSLSLSLSLSQR